jgi:crossover junction endodeoxyribonuclease RusA
MTHLQERGGTLVTLPWPDKVLSPNARVHWAKKATAVRKARESAAWVTRSCIGPRKPHLTRAALEVVFCPPDNRRRDRDNLIASLKGATDGISDALGIDDSRFISTYSIGEVVKGGAVRVTVREAQ